VKKLLLAAALAALLPAVAAAQVTIKLATLAPQGSTWHELLKEMAQRWEQASNGRVKLRIYPGGSQGSEGDMVRKLAVGQLQAASISNVGMHDVVTEPQVLSVPFLFDDAEQMECAFSKLRGRFDAALDKRGLIALQWSRIGSVQLFCSKPFRTPAEARDAKVWAWEGDPKSVEAYRLSGLKPVVLSATDMMPALQTGMIDCLPNVPLYMLTSRMFERANHMLDVPWSYMIGATLVRKDAWERIPADLRPKLAAIAAELGRKVDAEVRRLNVEAVTAMQKQGLEVVKGDPVPWRAAIEKSWPAVRGGVVPADVFDDAKAARDQCRAAARK
jgi:TRAP-type C4-dicarboxylate transport system substrate-binding protein